MTLDYTSDSPDLPDQKINYMEDMVIDHAEAFKDRSWMDGSIADLNSELLIPETGKVMEAGVWKGKIYNQLKATFGEDRCIGYDIYDYQDGNDSSVIIKDFRALDENDDVDLALFYNGMGGWHTNTGSKQAGIDYAYRNLVSGGYYIDVRWLWKMSDLSPDMSQYPDFVEVDVSEKQYIVYKKV